MFLESQSLSLQYVVKEEWTMAMVVVSSLDDDVLQAFDALSSVSSRSTEKIEEGIQRVTSRPKQHQQSCCL